MKLDIANNAMFLFNTCSIHDRYRSRTKNIYITRTIALGIKKIKGIKTKIRLV
jgi:hypothetical protein